MKILRTIIVFLICTPNCIAQNTKKPTVKTSEIREFTLAEGVYDNGFVMSDGTIWNMKISIPKIETDKEYPLIVALHWAGGESTYRDYSECLVFPGTSDMNAIVIVPSAGGKHWIEPLNEYKVIDFIKQIKKHWPIESDKIIVTGYSNGAIGSWEYAKKYSKLFCAAVAISGYYNAAKIKIPVYVIHGANDELFNKNDVAIAIQNSRKKGSKIDFEILPKLSHYMGCFYAESLKKQLEKIKTELWD